jgi:hypothetical protein
MNKHLQNMIIKIDYFLLDYKPESWENWLAVDRGGAVCVFECEPTCESHGMWVVTKEGSKWKLVEGIAFNVRDTRNGYWKKLKIKL